MSEYKGYDLFEEVDDADLRNRNRSICLYNMFQDDAVNGRCSARVVGDMVNYLRNLPIGDRSDTMSRLRLLMESGGTA
jgi:hypothetical protein